MKSEEVRKKFLDFFQDRGHAVVPSSSLIPDDPSVLLTSAGMQQFKPYYTGDADSDKDFGSKNTVSIQKSFRTTDIDEVGDSTHLTLLEMMGNFSFGGYFKKEAIQYAHDFITKELGLEISYVTIFEGSRDVPKDEESREIWNSLGVTDIREEGLEDVFWGPTGNAGPCGPTTEIYCKYASGEDVEVWNIVFNQFFFPGSREELLSGKSKKKLEPLESPGVDTGMGFERLMAVFEGQSSIYETDLLEPIVSKIKELKPGLDEKVVRVLADHLRSSCFLISDGVLPSNKEAGYILRRLIRKVIGYEIKYDIHANLLTEISKVVVEKYGHIYKNLDEKSVSLVLEGEKDKFKTALSKGLKELADYKKLTAKDAFRLYETYGLPFDLIKEMAPGGIGKSIKQSDFDKEFERHQKVSRAGAEKKFGGHGLILDTGELKATNKIELEKVTRLHTATHLMQAALRKVLGDQVEQRGSDITVERTRFDFTFDRKLTDEEVKKVENLVNGVIEKDLPVNFEEMPLEKAKKTGALYFFKGRYPLQVKVYYVGESLDKAFSKELCGGPHVERTGGMGIFEIKKQQAVAEGIRRVRADLKTDK
ncbi:MAG: alanine--tRNA ligase [Candidatus Colwellbacteria bacterium CG10_big_fil_rev_8_21_14_0_10_42_22]|uniref:alanine--tRNA ligase n=1 Tax=Candidatus Colwellbacteria bacterium CG10_big_fil_rev_8_21_14_0_10_42_22 TaxID=1974540 RepID=A0A2H0VFH9_9BACT|nr:MAG: alanine--tRNA ligase [Candidatus Colwellbacteria bacterium CG10_big_fil_rev_8_21_14_0_10_42_22]